MRVSDGVSVFRPVFYFSNIRTGTDSGRINIPVCTLFLLLIVFCSVVLVKTLGVFSKEGVFSLMAALWVSTMVSHYLTLLAIFYKELWLKESVESVLEDMLRLEKDLKRSGVLDYEVSGFLVYSLFELFCYILVSSLAYWLSEGQGLEVLAASGISLVANLTELQVCSLALVASSQLEALLSSLGSRPYRSESLVALLEDLCELCRRIDAVFGPCLLLILFVSLVSFVEGVYALEEYAKLVLTGRTPHFNIGPYVSLPSLLHSFLKFLRLVSGCAKIGDKVALFNDRLYRTVMTDPTGTLVKLLSELSRSWIVSRNIFSVWLVGLTVTFSWYYTSWDCDKSFVLFPYEFRQLQLHLIRRQEINFSAWGFIQLDRALFTKMLAGVVTFVIIVIQFNP